VRKLFKSEPRGGVVFKYSQLSFCKNRKMFLSKREATLFNYPSSP
jgi:hypothetical protein